MPKLKRTPDPASALCCTIRQKIRRLRAQQRIGQASADTDSEIQALWSQLDELF